MGWLQWEGVTKMFPVACWLENINKGECGVLVHLSVLDFFILLLAQPPISLPPTSTLGPIPNHFIFRCSEKYISDRVHSVRKTLGPLKANLYILPVNTTNENMV